MWRLDHEPYWVDRKGWQTLVGSLTEGFMSRFIPVALRKKSIISVINSNIGRLIRHNVENMRWATLQNINNTFGRFMNEFDEEMIRIIKATEAAVDTAIEFRSRHVEQNRDRLSVTQSEMVLIEDRITWYF